MFFLFYSWRFLTEKTSISAAIANLHKGFSFQEAMVMLCGKSWVTWYASYTPWVICELNCKIFSCCFDSKGRYTLRIICCLESRIRSLSDFVCKVLRERNLFVIFRKKIDQSSWRDSKFKGISLKISVIGIQVVVSIKKGSLLLFKSNCTCIDSFEIY